MFNNCKNAILSPFGRNVSVVNVILMEHSQRKRGQTPLWTKSLKLYLAGSLKNYICCSICSPTCGPPMFHIFAEGTSCVLCFPCWCCMCLYWRSCLCVCVCVYVIGRVWIFVVNLGDWRQVPGWQWSHGQPEPGWLLGRRWFTAGILSGTNTTSYSALIKHQKKGLRPQAFRSGKCFNPTTSKSRICILETFDKFNFIEVCRTINYTLFWVLQHCALVEHWPLSPTLIIRI